MSANQTGAAGDVICPDNLPISGWTSVDNRSQRTVPTWREAQAAGCHRGDPTGLMKKQGNIEALCYACFCTVDPTALSTKSVYCEDWTGHVGMATYM